MNRQIVKLFGLILVLYALLFGFTSYWSVFDAELAEGRTRPTAGRCSRSRQIQRGDILADDGTVIARSTAGGQGQQQDLRPPLPAGRAVRQPDRLQLRRPRAGRLRALPQRRAGRQQDRVPLDPRRAPGPRPGGRQGAVLARSRRRSGAAVDGLAGRRGSVVAMVPSTGEIKAMVSIPEYDPNSVQNPNASAQLNTDDERAALQPRDPGRVPAGLDDEGGDRHGRARQRRVHAELGPQRPLAAGRSTACRSRTPAASSSATST